MGGNITTIGIMAMDYFWNSPDTADMFLGLIRKTVQIRP
jgi:hypothetical protein